MLLAVGLAVVSPSVGVVAEEHSTALSPLDAPSYQAMMHIGKVFKEFDSDSSAMVVLEGQDKLGDSAHEFYDEIVRKLKADTAQCPTSRTSGVIPLTAAGSQSADGKAAYVQVFLPGAMATTAQQGGSRRRTRHRRPDNRAAGGQGLRRGQHSAPKRWRYSRTGSLALMAAVSLGVLVVMLLIVYRSVVTTILALVVVGIALFAA